MTQNLRQLPEQSRDALGTTVALDDTYDYDFNGNVAGITDALPGQPGNRDMSYDALDRLVGVQAGAAQGGVGSFAYDLQDNLTALDQGSRQFRYVYDTANRLAQIKSPGGAVLHTFGYDARGNTTSKDGGSLVFDLENRLTSSQLPTPTTYVYDGLGRRVRELMGASTYFYYGQGGKLLYTNDLKTSSRTDHIYLAGSLVANRKVPFGSNPTIEETYQHTDALGSPVAFTNENGVVVRRERMTAWGEPADGTWTPGPGYTGHQMDAASKLVYMQQRYYDPLIGRFLSVDPVPALSNPVAQFNRYRYANNDPYKFTDPDGWFGSSIERAIDRDIMARASGEISDEEYFDRAEARAAGGIAGLAVLAVARSPGVLRGALRMAAQRAVKRQEAKRPNGVPKDWVADKPAKGPGTIYRNPENPKHDTVRAVPGRPESSQPGQQTDHIVRTANGARYGEANTPVPVKPTESHVSPEKFKFVPADKLPKP